MFASSDYIAYGALAFLGSPDHPVAVIVNFATMQLIDTGEGIKYSWDPIPPFSTLIINLDPSCRFWFDNSGNVHHSSSCSPRFSSLFSYSHLEMHGNNLVTVPILSDNRTHLCSASCSLCVSDNSSSSSSFSSSYSSVISLGYCWLDCSTCNPAEKPYCSSDFPACSSSHSLSFCPYLSDLNQDGVYYRCVYDESREAYCYYDNSSSVYMCSFAQYIYNENDGSYVGSVDSPFLRFYSSSFSSLPVSSDFAANVFIHSPTFFYSGSVDYNGCKLSNLYAEIDFDFSGVPRSRSSVPCIVGYTSIPHSNFVIDNFVSDNVSDNLSVSSYRVFNHRNQLSILRSLKHIHSSFTADNYSFDNYSYDTSISNSSSDNFSSLFSSFLSSSPFSFDSSHLSLADSYCSLSFSLFSHDVSFSFCSPVVISFLNVVGAFVVVFSSFLFFFIAFK